MNGVHEKVVILTMLGTLIVFPAYGNDPSANRPPGEPLTLNEAVDMALSNGRAVKEAQSKYSGAIEEKKSSFADFLPKVSAAYSYTGFDNQPYMVFSGMKVPYLPTDLYRWSITAVQPVFTGFALSTKYDMAKLNIDLKGVEKEMAILDTRRSVKVAYYNALRAQRVLTVANDTVSTLESHESDADQCYKHDLIPYNDLLQSRVALANARQNRERVMVASEMALSNLNTLVGIDADEPTTLTDVEETRPSSPPLEQITAEAFVKRPELKIIRFGIRNADHAVRLVNSRHYPEVALTGSYERTGDNLSATRNPYGNDHNASVTLMAKWRVFEWGKTSFDVKKFTCEKTALEQRLKQTQDGIALEVKAAFLNRDVAQKNVQTAATALDQAKENFRLTDLQYRHQLATTTNVLDARAFLSQAMTNYYDALYGYLISEAELERAAGGSLQ